MSLSGKVALVTGAAQGLGKAFSEALLQKGAKVCLADVQKQKGEATAAAFQQQYGQNQAFFVKCDVRADSDWKQTFDKLKSTYGRLDIMVNNAGIANEHDCSRMADVNVRGVITGTNMAVDYMSKEKGGHGGLIINIASTAGVTPKAYFVPAYTGTKFAVVGFTRAWSHNPYLENMGLSFACLCPAFTQTDILDVTTTLYPEDASVVFKMTGVQGVSAVVKAFMQLVEDQECNGAVMTVTHNNGIQFYKKPLAISKM